MVEPRFIFYTKSRTTPQIQVKAENFFIEDLRIEEGFSYIGVDFGNTNSYVTKFIYANREHSIANYPEFFCNKQTKERLLKIEQELEEDKKNGLLSAKISKQALQSKKLEIIYNSNKIEGNRLSQGETTSIVAGEDILVDQHSAMEVSNLNKAYDYICENSSFLFESPRVVLHVRPKILFG